MSAVASELSKLFFVVCCINDFIVLVDRDVHVAPYINTITRYKLILDHHHAVENLFPCHCTDL